ncbi:MAG: peptide ABC transporter substrate-binding protein [Pseudomonadota bacterium]
MSEPRIAPDSEAAYAKSAGRQLLIFGLLVVAAIVALMWVLQALAGMVGGSNANAQAINYADQTITIALAEEPPQLDSTRATDASSGMVLGHLMEGLLRMDLNDRLEPAIAERWELTTTQATFWLRKDAKWSDGRPITAHDFSFAWRTVLDPATASRYSFLLYPIKNGRAINEGKLPPDQLGVSTPDDYTVVVELENPTPFFGKMVTFQTYFPLREDFYRSTNGKYGADADKLLSSGPFVATSWVHGASMYLEKNPHYWDRDRVKLNAINIGYITSDTNATLNFFKDNKIAFTTLSAENLREALEQRWHVKREQDGTVFYLEFNHQPNRLTRNKKLRQAMQLVIDMDELVYKVTKLPGYLPGESLFPVWLMGVNDYFRKEYPAPELKLDQDRARQLLAEAKTELGLERWPELVLLSGDNPLSSIQSEWVQGVLKEKLGLELKIDKQIFKQRLEKMHAGDFDMVLGGWGPDYDDPLTFGDLFASWNVQNRGGYASDELDRLVAIAQSSVDTEERMRAFAGIQQIIFDDVVILPMYERGVTYVVHPDLHNVKRRVIGAAVDYTSAYIDRGS